VRGGRIERRLHDGRTVALARDATPRCRAE
jgi:hypothetical protein